MHTDTYFIYDIFKIFAHVRDYNFIVSPPSNTVKNDQDMRVPHLQYQRDACACVFTLRDAEYLPLLGFLLFAAP